MKLFTREFLHKLQSEYKGDWNILDELMSESNFGLSFHDAIVFLAEKKGMTPEYIK